MRIFLILILAITITSCKKFIPTAAFSYYPVSEKPNYNDLRNWAAHPEKEDNADKTPGNTLAFDAMPEVDVFFVHPTTYFGDKSNQSWNARIANEKLNQSTDKLAILNQASIFNAAGKVYAPRYRQAHYHSYFTEQKEEATQAFEMAYQDVKAAFLYYLEKHNNGRPIIIASHSQGTTHTGRLLKEFFDNKPLNNQLVVAYLIGMPVPEDAFENIKPCERKTDLHCFCSWRSFKNGHYPSYYIPNNNFVVTNPLSWSRDSTKINRKRNQGAVLFNFDKGTKEALVGAQVHRGILWVDKPKFFGSIFFRTKNYHIGDFNLFYINIRENARLRATKFLESNN